MYKILIADNEPVIRDGLADMIAGLDLPVSVRWSACDGAEAVRMLTQDLPDIIITDIRMPEMDGLALCAYVHEHFPDIQLILITGFPDFSYARQAIRYDVVDFVLKPTDPENLRGALDKACSRLQEKSGVTRQSLRYRQLIFLQDLLYRNRHSIVYTVNRMQELQLDLTDYCLLAAAVITAGREAPLPEDTDLRSRHSAAENVFPDPAAGDCSIFLPEAQKIMEEALAGFSLFFLPGSDSTFYVLVTDSPRDEHPDGPREKLAGGLREEHTDGPREELAGGFREALIDGPREELADGLREEHTDGPREELAEACMKAAATCAYEESFDLAIGISSRFRDPLMLPEAAREADDACIFTAAEGQSGVELYRNLPRLSPEEAPRILSALRDVKTALEGGNERSLSRALDTFFTRVRNQQVTFSEMQRTCLLLSHYCEALLADHLLPEEHLPAISAGLSAATPDLLETELTRQVMDTFRQLHASGGSNADLIRQLRHFIEQHYAEPLFLDTLAAEVHLSPGYLSRLFKKEAGCTLSAYILSVRMEHACQLLRTTDRKTYEIAEMTGIPDPVYFSKLFKKTYGVKPSEFRSGHA